MGYFVKNRQLQSGSSGVVLPTGSSSQRPTSPAFGLIRYNTDSGLIEYFDGSQFLSLQSGGITYTVDNFTGDGSTVVFNMSSAPANAQQITVFVGSIYQIPTTNYTVDGSSVDITFTSAPPYGISINVIHTAA
jgi:hypothetical protein